MSNVQGYISNTQGIYVQRAGYIDPTNSVKRLLLVLNSKEVSLAHKTQRSNDDAEI